MPDHGRLDVAARAATVTAIVASAVGDGGGSREDTGARLRTLLFQPSSSARTALRNWERAALAFDEDPHDWPVTTNQCIAFCAWYTCIRGNSSSSLGTVISDLKSAITKTVSRDAWLVGADEADLRSIIIKFKTHVPSISQHAEQIRREDLERTISGPMAAGLAAGSLFELQMRAIMLGLFQTQSRGGDFLGGHLQWGHITFHETETAAGMELLLPFDKTGKAFLDPRRHHSYAVVRKDVICAVAAMRSYRAALPVEATAADKPVFPFVSAAGALEADRAPLTPQQFLDALRSHILAPAGYTEAQRYAYGYHSFRSGGETDHDVEGWPENLRAAIGRWAFKNSQSLYSRYTAQRMLEMLKSFIKPVLSAPPAADRSSK